MEIELTSVLCEYAQERDRNEFALGDTLDVKTGLILAGLTFLAIQCGEFVKHDLPAFQAAAQSVAILALVVGGVFSVMALWPADYAREATPEDYAAWITDTEKYRAKHPEEPSVSAEKLIARRLETAKIRVQTNLAINEKKSSRMISAFICLAVTFAANVCTLVIRLF